MAKPYQKEIDFAFFASNFGYSKSDYEELTRREKAFLYKAWENKLVSENTLLYNAVFTAVYNVNRKKGKKALKLWKKAQVKRADKELIEKNLEKIRFVEKTEGNSWIDLIYKTNNLPLPGRKRGDGHA